jgi:4-methylaminobutanoate oxidase (formaldehyde-forming)
VSKAGLRRALIQFQLLDPAPLLYHNEPIVRDGTIVGRITSGNYGHHLGSAIGLGYVPLAAGESADAALQSRYEIEIAGVRFAAKASLKPLYDPAARRPKS